MPALTRLIYSSRATRQLAEQDVRKLVQQASIHNTLMDVTGLLIFSGGYILQLLEGEAQTVDELYHHRITRDPRHTDFRLLLWERCDRRLFPYWAMGPSILNPADDAGQDVWERLCEQIKSQGSDAPPSQDAAMRCIGRFIQAFGDPVDRAVFSSWSSTANGRCEAS